MRNRHIAPRGPAFNPQFGSDREALIRTMLAEARGEGQRGMEAVGYNIRNRADGNYSGYGNSIRDQILAPKQYSSWNKYGAPNQAGKNALKVPENSPIYQQAAAAADKVLGRMEPDITNGSSNYRNPTYSSKASDKWANKLQDQTRIGNHVFGRAPGFKVPEQTARAMPGDQQMMASISGDKNQDAGTSPMSTMFAQAVQPKQTQVATSNPPLPPEANSNQRYAAMNSVAPARDYSMGGVRQMANNSAYAPNRMAAMESAKPDQIQVASSNPEMPAGEFLSSRYGQDPGVQAPMQPNMADTPVLHEPMQAGGPMGEGFAMNGAPSGLGDMMANAVVSPQAPMGPGFDMAGMGGGFGGMDMGGGLGGFDFGSLFG